MKEFSHENLKALRGNQEIRHLSPKEDVLKVHRITINKAFAYPEYGFRNLINQDGSILTVAKIKN